MPHYLLESQQHVSERWVLVTNINMMVGTTTGHSIIDGLSGYNKIEMHPLDDDKISLSTPKNHFYYIVMPSNLRMLVLPIDKLRLLFSLDATWLLKILCWRYCCKIQRNLLSCNRPEGSLERYCQYKLRMNPLKCTFGVWIMIHCPQKKELVLIWPMLRLSKNWFHGRMSNVCRFVTTLFELLEPFHKLLKKNSPFRWVRRSRKVLRKSRTCLGHLQPWFHLSRVCL